MELFQMPDYEDVRQAFRKAAAAKLTIRFGEEELSTTTGHFVQVRDGLDWAHAFVELVAEAADGH